MKTAMPDTKRHFRMSHVGKTLLITSPRTIAEAKTFYENELNNYWGAETTDFSEKDYEVHFLVQNQGPDEAGTAANQISAGETDLLMSTVINLLRGMGLKGATNEYASVANIQKIVLTVSMTNPQ